MPCYKNIKARHWRASLSFFFSVILIGLMFSYFYVIEFYLVNNEVLANNPFKPSPFSLLKKADKYISNMEKLILVVIFFYSITDFFKSSVLQNI